MSDTALADDLFPDSPPGNPVRLPSPIASSSRTPDARPSPPPTPPALEADEGDVPGDLFGDEEEARPATPRTDRGRSSTATPVTQRSKSPNPLEYAEEEVNVSELWANLALPQWPKLQPTDGKVWHMKLPAYVNIEPRPYDPDFYRATLDDTPIDGKAEPLAARSRMIGVRNTIRYKWVTGGDGEPTRQSNARMLRWSDGSVSLQLGSDLFDVAPSQGATLARPSDPRPETNRGPSSQPEAPTSNSSTTFLCVAAEAELVLITETAIAGQLSLVPTSMTSKTHLELAKHVGQQHVKHSRMKMLDNTKDQAKYDELLMKASGIKPKVKSRTGGGGGSRKKRAMSEESDDRGDRERDIPGSKRVDEGEYDEDDGFVVADSDEEGENTDEAAYGSKKKGGKRVKAKGRKRKGSEELDEMEEAERRIEQRERERKRAKVGSGGAVKGKKSREYVESEEDEDAEGEEEDMEMDVESEGD